MVQNNGVGAGETASDVQGSFSENVTFKPILKDEKGQLDKDEGKHFRQK